jgi:hypothetical protein
VQEENRINETKAVVMNSLNLVNLVSCSIRKKFIDYIKSEQVLYCVSTLRNLSHTNFLQLLSESFYRIPPERKATRLNEKVNFENMNA